MNFQTYSNLLNNIEMGLRDYIQNLIQRKKPEEELKKENQAGRKETLVPGEIKPQLQKNYNCIVSGTAQIIWYWGNNGFEEELIAGRSFDEIQEILQKYMSAHGGFRNDGVPKLLTYYISETTDKLTPYVKVHRNPNYSLITNFITAGKPCLLGFAVGSPYGTEGHMTCCVGFQSDTVIVADGCQQELVRQKWSPYNDCIITIDFVEKTSDGKNHHIDMRKVSLD